MIPTSCTPCSAALIDCFYRIVDAFHVIALVGKKGAFFQRNRLIRSCEDLSGNGGIGDITRRGQLIERQPGDAVHQHMAFITPVELIPPLIVLVGGRVGPRAQSGSALGCFPGLNLSLVKVKDLGLFCFVFAATGVESRPTNEASTIPIS